MHAPARARTHGSPAPNICLGGEAAKRHPVTDQVVTYHQPQKAVRTFTLMSQTKTFWQLAGTQLLAQCPTVSMHAPLAASWALTASA